MYALEGALVIKGCCVYVAGQRLNIEWSCGHQGFVSIDWLMKTTVKPRQKRLIAVSYSPIPCMGVLKVIW